MGGFQCLYVLSLQGVLKEFQAAETRDNPSIQNILQLLPIPINSKQNGGHLDIFGSYINFHRVFQVQALFHNTG